MAAFAREKCFKVFWFKNISRGIKTTLTKMTTQKIILKSHENLFFQLTAAFEKLTYTEAGVKAPSKDVDQV